MSLLVVSPEFASHYGPLAVIAHAVQRTGRRVVVATGPELRSRVEADGLEWYPLRLGAGSNDGVAARDLAIERFIRATEAGPIATIRRQALDREHDLLWEPERVATEIAELCDRLSPEQVLVDHVSFGSTLAMYATGRHFATLVPGHPSQLPVGEERYGVPSTWPARLEPDQGELAELETLIDRVTAAFTARWNDTLASVSAASGPVDDAFRVHGHRVLYNSVPSLHDPTRSAALPEGHRFVGPLVRDEGLPHEFRSWFDDADGRPRVYVALGTFLSHRGDVLERVAAALRRLGVRAAIAVGSTPPGRLGPIPHDWLVAPRLPQVAMLGCADLAVHHGGNNSVQEALAIGARQLVLPFSTDQFANAADLERAGAATVLAPNEATAAELAGWIDALLSSNSPEPAPRPDPAVLVEALFQ